MERKIIIPIFVSHQGCPHTCVFCNQVKITGKGSTVSGEMVDEIIHTALSHMKVNRYKTIEVAFYGGSFTALPLEEQAELLQPVTEAIHGGQISSIRLSTRPDAIDENICCFLKEKGVKTVELGVQSMDDDVLRLSERGHTRQDTFHAVRLLKTYGFELGLQIMPGLPGASLQSDWLTGQEVVAMDPDMVRIYPTLVLRDTKLEILYQKGDYRPLSLQGAIDICKKLVILMAKAYIPVIRLGLQASEQIDLQGDVVAGPFHPAFRQLVESDIYREGMDALLANCLHEKIAQALFKVPVRELSTALGQKKANLDYLKLQYGMKDIKIIGDYDLSPHTVVLQQVNGIEVNVEKKRPLY